MAEENIGGLAAEISGDASRLFSVLQQSELRMREFVSRYGNVNLQIHANIQIPSATAVLDARRNISRLFRDPAAGALMVPLQMALPSQTATSTFAKGLVNQIGAISVKVIGNFEWGQRPPGTIPANVVPGGSGQVARPVQSATAIAAGGPKTIVRKGGPGQRTTYSDGSTAWEPSGGGTVGGGGGFAVGGAPVVPEIGGFNPYGYPGGRTDLYENMLAQGDFIARQQAAATGGPRGIGGLRPGQAGGLARARQQAEAEAAGYQRDQGRFIRLGTVPSQVVQRPSAPSTVVARQESEVYQPPIGIDMAERERELRALNGEFGPEEQAAAEARQPVVDYGRRRGKRATQKVPTRKVGPEERAAIFAATPELEESQAARTATQTRLISAAQATTVRAPGTFLSGLVSNLFGGAQARESQRLAREALTEQTQLQVRLTGAKAKEFDIETAYNATQNTAQKKQIRTDLNAQREVVEKLGNDLNKAKENATALGVAATEASKGGLRNLTAGFIGGIAGGLAFGVGMQIVSAGFGLMVKAIDPVFERLTGYVGLSNKVVDSLSDQARAQHGLTGIVVAGTFAQAGLGEKTANSIRSIIEQRVAVEAGNKAFTEQFDLIKAGVQLQANPNLGITTGTGGFLGSALFQTPGTIEQLANLTPRGTLPGQIGDVLGGVGTVLSGGTPRDIIEKITKLAPQRAEAFALALNDLGEAAKRGAPDVINMAKAVQSSNQTLVEQTSQLLLANGASQDWVDALKASNFALVGPGGAVASQQQYQDFFKGAQRGAAITPAADATAQLRTLTIPARMFQLQATADLQRQSNQIQFAAQRAAQPFLPFGTTIPGGAGALSPQAQALTAGGAGFNQQTQIQINNAKVTLSGQLSAFGPQFQQQGLASFDRLQGLGQQGAALQTGIISAQVNLATAQYAEQLRLARLSESDLLQLTKQEGASRGDNLGYLQRQVIDEQRISQQLSLQSEQLSIQLQQRQINFQIALAGFTAPGATPAERAARIEEAKLEAKYAQEQLDIRKQQAAIQAQVLPIQFKIEDTQFQRALTAIEKQIGLITQARQVTIDVAGMQERLAQVNAQIDLAAKDFQTYAQAAESAAVGVISDISSLMAVYGGKAQQWFSAISTAYADAFVKYIQRATGALIGSIGQLSGNNLFNYSSGGGKQPPNAPLQSGFLGSVSRATTFTVGEAGTETVAVLRNPRAMTMGGGGMQINLSVVVTGNTVRSDDDLRQLVARITAEVEKSMSRKLSLLGGRGAAVS